MFFHTFSVSECLCVSVHACELLFFVHVYVYDQQRDKHNLSPSSKCIPTINMLALFRLLRVCVAIAVCWCA